MAVFKELDPELHLKLVEGYEDELAPEAAKLEAFYQAHRKCKRCGQMMRKETDVRTAWEEGHLLPKSLLRCDDCGFLIEPFTGVILDSGKASKIPQPLLQQWKVDH
jgi:hypothetical protein